MGERPRGFPTEEFASEGGEKCVPEEEDLKDPSTPSKLCRMAIVTAALRARLATQHVGVPGDGRVGSVQPFELQESLVG